MIRQRAYVGVGSNLDGPVDRVRQALDALARLPGTALRAASALYRNPPMGPTDQPYYVNAVAELDTELDARSLLAGMQAIEAGHGRLRKRRWGPRTLDLDLLLLGDRRSDTPDLKLPHPGVADRAFVLVPLAEIAPDLEIPGFGAVAALCKGLPEQDRAGLERVSS